MTTLEFLDNKENKNTKSQMKSDRKAKLIQAPIDKTKDNISLNILKNTDIKLSPIEISPIQSKKPTNQTYIKIEIKDSKPQCKKGL
ncbi:17195_t:CDS:2, partial [Dentiscutata heterogama]